MHSISYARAESIEHAIQLGSLDGAKYIGGGTNLLDLYKSGVERPIHLVDVTRLPLNTIEELPDGGVRIGALVSNTAAANHPLIRERYPLLSHAILSGANGQLRNMATVGGNLLQRTRCYYFTDPTFQACNKRTPGSGCAAKEGFNRIHAILGASDACIAVNPSDMNVALFALDAAVRVRGPGGERRIAMGNFHRLPGDTPHIETTLETAELITAVDLPPSLFADASHYLKVRDRASFAFALVSVAAAVRLEQGIAQDVRIVLGGVSHKPWRASAAEAEILRKPLTDETLRRAAAAAVNEARPYEYNAYKIELVQRAIVKALRVAGGKA